MAAHPFEVAVYGKGGIGKSTVSANLSIALSMAGKQVLQIGCDPKHDSTRLLTGGRQIPTALDYLKSISPAEAKASEILFPGSGGVGCIEAGGPRPGVGCAGRGIISVFEFLQKQGIKENYDLIVYDVLGDVVCGGFAVPIRREYADAIYLVTSGEYMSLYAANNILRGIRNFDGAERHRVAGIILNARALPDEELRVRRFADEVQLPICASIPRSHGFAEAEANNCTLMELSGWQKEQAVFKDLASQIVDHSPLFEAKPLTDEALEACVLYGRTSIPAADIPEKTEEPRAAEARETEAAELAPPAKRLPLYGCAFNGAATIAVHLTDAEIIAHAPRACAFYTWQNISSPGRKNLFHRGILLPSSISPNFSCTEMTQADAVFGGTEKLREHVRQAVARKPGAVVVISSCVSGIIGDDLESVKALATPETPVIVVKADGDINGDYMEGLRMSLYEIADNLIDTKSEMRPMTVNLIGEAGVLNDLDLNYQNLRDLLAPLGITIGCRFLGGATAEEVRNLTAAPLNILASDSEDNRALRDFLSERFGCRFFEDCMPVGFEETRRFLQGIAAFFGKEDLLPALLDAEKQRYEEEIARLRPQLSGKTLLLSTINENMDWLLDTASAVGMKIGWVGVLNYLHTELSVTRRPDVYPVEEIADWPAVTEAVARIKPDIILTNYTFSIPEGDYITDAIPMGRPVGFQSGIPLMRRLAQMTKQKKREGEWMHDKALFEKYFA